MKSGMVVALLCGTAAPPVLAGGSFAFLPPLGTTAVEGPTVAALPLSVRIDLLDAAGSIAQPGVAFLDTVTGTLRFRSADADGDDDCDCYQGEWHPAKSGLATGSTVRIRALVPRRQLGFVDFVVANAHRPLKIRLHVAAPAVDRDADGVFDWLDDCPDVFDPNQLDSVGNGVGDECRRFVGPAGGVAQNNGATVTFPEDALDSTVEVAVTVAAETPPAGFVGASPVFRFAPEGAVFARPATVRLPFIPGIENPTIFWSNASGGYSPIGGTAEGDTISARVVHFSTGFVAAGRGVRTIVGVQKDTFVNDSSSATITRDLTNVPIAALVPDGAGASYVVHGGKGFANGTFEIDNAPRGEILLQAFYGLDKSSPGSTVLDSTFDQSASPLGDPNLIDGDRVFVTQEGARVRSTGLPYFAMTRQFVPTPFVQTPGIATVLSGNFADVSASRSVRFTFAASSFSGIPAAHPACAADDFIGVEAQAIPGGPTRGTFGPSVLDYFATLGDPDLDTGLMQYGVPTIGNFGITAFTFFVCRIPFQLPGAKPLVVQAENNFADTLDAFDGATVGATISRVESPSIEGRDLFVEQRGVGVTPLISWQPPLRGSPNFYFVRISKLFVDQFDRTRSTRVAEFTTGNTSIRVPSGILEPGESYFLRIRAGFDGGADIVNAPFRPTLPAASADALSSMFEP